MFDFLRVSSAVPKLSVADTKINTEYICEKINEAVVSGSNIIVLPELAITGYTCGDLFFQQSLIDNSNIGLEQIVDLSRDLDVVIVVGAPIVIDGQLYNCGVVIACGRICGIVPKTFIPNHAQYSEKRWFSSSKSLSKSDVDISEIGIKKYGSYTVPVGSNLVFNINNGYKFGIEICEDLWTVLPPSTFLALGGAEVIVNLSASDEGVAKREYRRELVVQQSARTMCSYIYCSAGCDESTTDLIFSGHSVISENGTLIDENTKKIDNDYVITADIDLGKIRADRKRFKSFKDSVCNYSKYEKTRTVDISFEKLSVDSDGTLLKINKLPFVPEQKAQRIERCDSVFQMQVAGLKKRVEVTNSKLVVGVSGGLDSTLALLVSAKVMRDLGRPASDVYGITMPCFGTSDRTLNNSLTLMEKLGVTAKTINIKDACITHFNDIGHDVNKLDTTYENCQARERTQVLMDFSGSVGGFVVGTGDLSELALGWCTYNGDHMSMYGVNSGVPKTLIRWIIESVLDLGVFEDCDNVLKDILDTPISPELLPPDESGKIAQVTEDIVGPYALHDFFIYYCLRFGYSPAKIYQLAKIAFNDDFDNATILKWLKVFYRRFFTQQFKRSCLPDGVKIGSVGISPRGDLKMPSDASAKIWLREVEEL